MNDFHIWQTLKKRVDDQLILVFEREKISSERLKTAMQYAVLSSGKRLRPILIYLTGKTLNLPLDKLDMLACAIECMHAYSLIHDDLPAMDDDDLRRGKPTCHRAFDEATAILAGDALQALAFQLILQIDSFVLTPKQKNEMALILSQACGAGGMVSGQSMDLEYLGKESLSLELLEKIHQLKTGVLLETCVDLAILAESEIAYTKKQNLRSFAQYFGLAFQIQDDYLDVYGETEILGKQQGADERQGKTTYANFHDKANLLDLIQTTYQKALSYLLPFEENSRDLIQFIEYLSKRNY